MNKDAIFSVEVWAWGASLNPSTEEAEANSTCLRSCLSESVKESSLFFVVWTGAYILWSWLKLYQHFKHHLLGNLSLLLFHGPRFSHFVILLGFKDPVFATICVSKLALICAPHAVGSLCWENSAGEGSEFWTLCGYFIFLKLIEDVKSNTNCKTFSGKMVQISESDGGIQVEKPGPVPAVEVAWPDHSLPSLGSSLWHCCFLLMLTSLLSLMHS